LLPVFTGIVRTQSRIGANHEKLLPQISIQAKRIPQSGRTVAAEGISIRRELLPLALLVLLLQRSIPFVFVSRMGRQIAAFLCTRVAAATRLPGAFGHSHSLGLLLHQVRERGAVVHAKLRKSSADTTIPVSPGFALTVGCRRPPASAVFTGSLPTGANTMPFNAHRTPQIGMRKLWLRLAEGMKEMREKAPLFWLHLGLTRPTYLVADRTVERRSAVRVRRLGG
jgi:hypothetical protein